MRILYGILGVKLSKWQPHTTQNQDLAIKMLLESNHLKKGEKILIIADKKRGEHADPLIKITVAE